MSDEVERGCGGVPVDDDRLRVHCSRCYRFDTVADHLERARAESAVLRERAERAEVERDELRGLVEHHQDTRCCFYEANGVGEGDCRNYGHACPYCAAKEWLLAHPAIPEGTPR